jgi:hypothetical protein
MLLNENLSPSLVVSIIMWLILLSKIKNIFLNLVKHTSKNHLDSKDSKSVIIYSRALVIIVFLAILKFFTT